MSHLSNRRLLTIGVLVLGLGASTVACGGEESSDLSREDLLAILEAVQVDPVVAESLTDEQLQEAVDQVNEALEGLPAPATTVTEAPDITAGGDAAAPTPTDAAPAATDAPATDDTAAPQDGGAAPVPSVVISIPGVSIPVGAILGTISTLAVTDLATSDVGGIRTFLITVTENGLGTNDITGVKADWIVDGLSTPLNATKKTDVSATKSVWSFQAEAGPARVTITARDSKGATVSRSFVLSK